MASVQTSVILSAITGKLPHGAVALYLWRTQMTKLLSIAELNKAIDKLNGDASKLQGEYQRIGVLCLEHLSANGDVGPINRLIVGMPKGLRRLAMATWAVAHGALVPNQDTGTRDTMPLRFTREKKTDTEAAAQSNWWEAAPEREISDVFDLQVAVKSLINRAKGKNLLIGGANKAHEAKSILSMLAAGVDLPNPFAEEDAAAAAAVVDAKGEAKLGTAPGSTSTVPQVPVTAKDAVQAAADKPAVQREVRAAAKGTPARKGAAKKATGRARAAA
jgi:hypothetical protein